MSLVAKWDGAGSITHSILINLFIKLGLDNFSPASSAKYFLGLKNFSACVDRFYGGAKEM